MMLYCLSLHLIMVVVFSSAAQAGPLFVDDDNCPGPGSGTEPDPFCAIQAAIDAARHGDEIVVAPGTYFETINLLGKAIRVRSSDGPDVTIIDAEGDGRTVATAVTCNSGEGPDTVLRGFTLTGGFAITGGGMLNDGASPTVIHCVFSDNVVDGGNGMGGGMYNEKGCPTVIGCVFIGNTALGMNSGAGAGMYNEDADPMVIRCTFMENSAPLSLGAGGGMFNSNSAPLIVNCLFHENIAICGSGVSNNTSNPTMTNCTVVANLGGVGILNFLSNPVLSNCILWGNPLGQIVDWSSSSTVAFSDVQGGWPGTGNINANPVFVDHVQGDFRLSPGSPCIDAGDNDALPEDIQTDLDGNPRFLEVPETPDTGNGDLPIVDMGAYEALGGGCLAVTGQEVVCHGDGTTFSVNVEGLNACTGGITQVSFTGSGGAPGEEACFTVVINDSGFCCSTEICVTIPDCSGAGDPPCPADLNNDGHVGIEDMLIVLGSWGGPGGDLNADGTTDVLDFLGVIGSWGPCP